MKLILITVLLLALAAVSGCIGTESAIKLILGNKDAYIGKDIVVYGYADAMRTVCTLVACGVENPCCNSCRGQLLIKDSYGGIEIRGSYEGKSIGCGGNGCRLACYPLEQGKKYLVTGTFKTEAGEYFVDLKHFEGDGG